VGVGAREQVFLDREVLEDAAPLQDLHDARAHEVGGVAAVDALPVELDRALGDLAPLGVSRLEIALSVVDLPAPLAPRRATRPPAGTSSDTPFNTRITWS